jgi:hypothetical protein
MMREDNFVSAGIGILYDNKIQFAKENGFWFYGKKHSIEFWHSPESFEINTRVCGSWVMSINWKFRKPIERIKELEILISECKSEAEDIAITHNLEMNKALENNNDKDWRIDSKLSKDELEMIEVARKKRFWFYGRLINVEFWFSPNEFKTKAFEKSEWFKKINWLMKSPNERLKQLSLFAALMEKELTAIKESLLKQKGLWNEAI